MADFSELSIAELVREGGFECPCGRSHAAPMRAVEIGAGVVKRLPEVIGLCGGTRPFIVADANTLAAAGGGVTAALDAAGVRYSLFEFPQRTVEPDEYSIGQLIMAFDTRCDMLLGVGSGTINDICKLTASVLGKPYAVVATAPSMDGWASNSAAMISSGVKVSIYCAAPSAVIADTDILAAAPGRMLAAGLGDMLAKYISICEWRIANIVNGEYYCENTAALMRRSLAKCVGAARGLSRREPEAVGSIVEGLILSGIAMSFAGVSRPASGIEHYFSHVWDMLALKDGKKPDLHGIQVGIGTVMTLRIYDEIKKLVPDRERALKSVADFDLEMWKSDIRSFFGAAGEGLIALEESDPKFDKALHRARLERVIAGWDDILNAVEQELPDAADIEKLLRMLGAPVSPGEIGVSDELARKTFDATKDIRNKYIASHLLWDIGESARVREGFLKKT